MAKAVKLKDADGNYCYPVPYFPIGFVLFMADDTNPNDIFPGTWERISQGRYIMGAGTSSADSNGESRTLSIGQTGGNWNHNHSYAHTHTMPHTHTMAHTHTLSHTHTMAHTHSYSHTHGVPGVAHVHSVGAHKHAAGTLFAQIAFSSSYLWNKYITTSTFKANARKSVSGTSSDSTQTPSDSTAVGGSTADSSAFNTGSTTPSATTTNSQSTSTSGAASTSTTSDASATTTSAASNGTTSAASSSTTASQSSSTTGSTQGIPPYLALAVWKRVA